MEVATESCKVSFFPANAKKYDDWSLLWSERLFITGKCISNLKLYSMVADKLVIPEDNIIPYHMVRCLRYDPEYKTELKFNFLYITIAISLPASLADPIYHNCHDVAQRFNIPIIESIKVKDQNNATIYTIEFVKYNTTVDVIRNELATVLGTKPTYIDLYYHGKLLLGHELVVDLFFESCFFKPVTELNVNRHIPILIFGEDTPNIPGKKQLRYVNLTFLSKETSINIIPSDTLVIKWLKEYIRKKYGLPMEKQELLYKSRLLEDHQKLKDLYFDDESNDTGSVSISLIFKPFYIDVKFVNNYIYIPEDGYVQFPGMATVKEMKERFSKITSIPTQSFALFREINWLNSSTLEELEDGKMLHEIRKSYSESPLPIKVLRSILVCISGEEPFRVFIYDESETIEGIPNRFNYIPSWKGKIVLVQPKNLKKTNRLLDIIDEEVTLIFERKDIKPKQSRKTCMIS